MEPEYVRSTGKELGKPAPRIRGSPVYQTLFPKTWWIVLGIAGCSVWIASVDRLSYSGKIALLFFIIAMVLWIFPACRPG